MTARGNNPSSKDVIDQTCYYSNHWPSIEQGESVLVCSTKNMTPLTCCPTTQPSNQITPCIMFPGANRVKVPLHQVYSRIFRTL